VSGDYFVRGEPGKSDSRLRSMTRDWNIVDEGDAEPTPAPPAEGLDARRIRLVVEERRAANRARLRRRIVVPVAIGVAFAAAVRAAFAWRTSTAFAIACALTAAVAAVVAFRAWRARAVTVADRPDASPETPPDFTALGGGGGDAAARLARMRDEPSGDA
jgi:hypothetical protein